MDMFSSCYIRNILRVIPGLYFFIFVFYTNSK